MVELFDKEEAIRIGLFVASSVIGMLFAYYRKWSFEMPDGIGLFQYIFDDPHAIGRALTTLTAMCVGAGGLSYLDSLTASQILIAGASIGLLVPQTVAQNDEGGKKKSMQESDYSKSSDQATALPLPVPPLPVPTSAPPLQKKNRPNVPVPTEPANIYPKKID